MKNSITSRYSKPSRPEGLNAPSHLLSATQEWWLSVATDYDLAPHHAMLLTLACEAWDRCSQARSVLDADGIIVGGREAAVRPHPCIAIERDSRLAFARLVAQLSLDAEMPSDPGVRAIQRSNRPGGWRGPNGRQ